MTQIIRQLKNLSLEERKQAGLLVNQIKTSIDEAFAKRTQKYHSETGREWVDMSLPGILPPQGHLHIVTQAITEITRIFERISFTRVRHPEVDWDYYPFEALNMPANHPARDEWETFFIQSSKFKTLNSKFSKIVLTPHTSNGQVREMEKGKLPIRMINIAKCYRRQSDISHVPMFHQFEGLYIDKDVSIGHLKGVLDYFVKSFFGEKRKARIRPFHFQFTEPSFEVDISCGVCLGKGCKLCKEGWLELGGAGMVHPVVLQNGAIDPARYNGFAFGWGVERTYMMKAGTQLDDIRLLYSNDLRFLEQF
jgi:phenylalanyl-tRNA synthetase alpha chain